MLDVAADFVGSLLIVFSCFWLYFDFVTPRLFRSTLSLLLVPAVAVAILASPLTGQAALATGAILAALTAVKIVSAARRATSSAESGL